MADRIDRLVLTELDINARISTSELARRLRLGRDIVEYRLEKLRDDGVLTKTMAQINPYRLGLMIFKCYLRLRSSVNRRQELITWLKLKRSVFWVAETWGRFDAAFSALVRSPDDFDKLQISLLTSFPDLILSHEMALNVEVLSYPRRHLVKSSSKSKALRWGGKLQQYNLDAVEAHIISCLSEDARLSLTDLADRCSSTPAIVSRRVAALEDAGVIIGYRTQVDLAKLGLRYVKSQLEISESIKGTTVAQALMRFCETAPNVVYLIRQLGQYRIEVESEEAADGEYGIILPALDSTLGHYLKSSEMLLISKDHHHRLNL